jgi:plastocyanin
MKRLSTCLFLVLAASAVLAVPASAQVQPAGTGEPAFTNTTTNRQFFEWPAKPGADAYRVRFSWYKDNVLVHEATADYGPSAGSAWADWAGLPALVEGSKYSICAQGYYSFPSDSLYYSDGANSCSMGTMLNRRPYTTIDRTGPTISVSLAGGAAATRQASVPLQIGFQDAHAGPFPASFVCVTAGAGSCDSYSYSAACSVPADSNKNTSFSCQVDVGSLPDGPVKVCAIASDAAVPDNPNGPNQTGSATSANHSTAQCDTIVLDRGAPSLTVAGPASAQVGQLVEFTSQASDGGSGVAGAVQWKWGDNTPSASGASATHTFTQPGTYEVEAKVTDAAGNETVATKSVAVSAPPATPTPGDPGPSQPGEPTSPGPSDPGPSDPGEPAPSDPADPRPSDPTKPGAKPPVNDPADGLSEEEIAKAAGGGKVARTRIDSLTLLIPKRVRLAKARRALVLGVATGQAGQLEIQLVRRGRAIARMQKVIAAGAGKQRLRLPRRLRTGVYTLKVSFTKAGADWAASGGTKVRFVR